MTIIPDFTALIVSGIVVCLVLVLKSWFFEPLAQAMEQREATSSSARKARDDADAAVSEVEARLAEALAETRQEGYREMDRIRREATERAEAKLGEARGAAEAALAAGKQSLREESVRAAAELERSAEDLAGELALRVLRRAS